MPLTAQSGAVGPLRWAWRPHVHGNSAEPAVRAWLAGPLDAPAQALPIARDRHGRPRLGAPFAGGDLGWSHSGDGLLMAYGAGVAGQPIELGVDLERPRPRPRAHDLARRFFTPAEADWLQAMPVDARDLAFVRLWCLKEAVLKAHGRGLAFGLHRLAFGERDGSLALVDCDAALGVATDWSVHELVPRLGYRAALAWRARPGR